ncbi:nucleotidyl transferase AbiEii/AbiGii toxin family protein [Dermacoccus abyssi]
MKHSAASVSLGHRLRNAAAAEGVDTSRLRRQLAFQRLLARLAGDDRWVLKGGFLLEARFQHGARATKDLDLVHDAGGWSALDLQDALDEALDVDLGDSFAFDVATPKALRDSGSNRQAWRVRVTAHVAGTPFEPLTVDVVSQVAEATGAIEYVTITAPVAIAQMPPVEVAAVDLAQHAAEKVHAYTRTYAAEQPSSRVKDLVDLALIIESGLISPGTFGARVRHTFLVRDGAAPPAELTRPPDSWHGDYAALVRELSIEARDADTAFELVRHFYAHARIS